MPPITLEARRVSGALLDAARIVFVLFKLFDCCAVVELFIRLLMFFILEMCLVLVRVGVEVDTGSILVAIRF